MKWCFFNHQYCSIQLTCTCKKINHAWISILSTLSHSMSYFSFINLKYSQSLEAIEDFWIDWLSKLSHIFCAHTISTHYLRRKYWECITSQTFNMHSMIKSSQKELTSWVCMEPSNASKMHPFFYMCCCPCNYILNMKLIEDLICCLMESIIVI